MAISKKAQAKIDALKKSEDITIEQNSSSEATANMLNDTTEEVVADATPIELLDESDLPPMEVESVESVDTELEKEFSVQDLDVSSLECPLVPESDFRLYGILMPTHLSLKHNIESIDRLDCSDDNKELIRRFIKEERFSYYYVLFNGEQYGYDKIETFIVLGQTDYDGPVFSIFDQTKLLNADVKIKALKVSLKYDLSERIHTLQFLAKNIDSVVDQYLAGGKNDFSELRLKYHKDVRAYPTK